MAEMFSGTVMDMKAVIDVIIKSSKTKGVTTAAKRMSALEKKTKLQNERLEKFQKGLKEVNGTILQASLSSLFFGMALQRLAFGIGRATVGTFLKISQGATEAGGNITALTAHFELLKFTVGEAIATALGPMLPILISIITRVSDWVEQHKELTAKLILFIATIGTIIFLGAQLTLFLNGMSALLKEIITKSAKWGPPIIKWLLDVSEIGLGPILWALGIILLVIGAIWLLWKTNFGHFQEAVKAIWGNLKTFFVTLFSFLVRLFKNVMDFFVAVFEGRWDDAFSIAIDTVFDIITTIKKLVSQVEAFIINIGIFVANFLVSLFFKVFVTGFIRLEKMAAHLIDKFLGTSYELRLQPTFDYLTAKAKKDAEKYQIGYITQAMLKPSFEKLDAQAKISAQATKDFLGLEPTKKAEPKPAEEKTNLIVQGDLKLEMNPSTFKPGDIQSILDGFKEEANRSI